MSRSKTLLVILIVLSVVCLSIGLVACQVNAGDTCEHVYEFRIIESPTMDVSGKVEVTCTKCGTKEEVTVPALSDLSEWKWTVSTTTPATCEQTGVATYTSVSPYAGLKVDIVISQKDHTYGELIEEIPSTCYSHGVKAHYVCSECNKLFDSDKNVIDSLELPLSDHKYGDLIAEVPSTCVTHGVMAHYECAECGKVFDSTKNEVSSLELPLSDHNYGDLIEEIPATCVEIGHVAHYECADCGKLFDADKHEIESDEISMVAHSWNSGVVTVEPTCMTEGVKTYTCTVCGGTKTESVAKSEHTPVTVPGKKATCTEDGLTDGSVCSVCGTVLVAQTVIPALDHDWGLGVVTVEPTCSTEGAKTFTCSNCQTTKVEVLTKVDHTRSTVPGKDATCTEDGLTDGSVCSVCGTVLVEQKTISAKGHSWNSGVVTTEPTFLEDGEITYTCTVCGETKTDVVPKLTNVFSDKTYVPANFDSRSDKTNKVIGVYVWSSAVLNLNGAGQADCSAYPFNGRVQFVLRDEEIGRFVIEYYSRKQTAESEREIKEWEENNQDYYDMFGEWPEGRPEAKYEYKLESEYDGYVDMETGIIVFATDSLFTNVYVSVPSVRSYPSSSFKASAWNGVRQGLAISYDYNSTQYNIFVVNGVVYFGVTFEDADGNSVSASDVYNADYVAVKQNGSLVMALGYDGAHLVELDGYQGTYASETEADLVLNGLGKFVWGEKSGIYSYNSVSEMFELYVQVSGENVEYYEVAIEGTEYLAEKTMVTVTLDFGAFVFDGETPSGTISVNKNIAFALPTYTTASQIIKGWKVNGTEDVILSIVPTEDVVLNAVVSDKVVINLVDVIDGDPTVVYLGDGDELGTVLPSYVANVTMKGLDKLFIGWFVDVDGDETEVTATDTISKDDSGITIYARWKDVFALYGEYKGFETWGKNLNGYFSNSSSASIDLNGKVKGGRADGKVAEFNEATGEVLFGSYHGSYYPEDEILVIHDNSGAGISTDSYILFKNAKTVTMPKENQIVWNNGETRLMEADVEYNDGSTKHYVLLYNRNVLESVTYDIDGGTAINMAVITNKYAFKVLTVTKSDGTIFAQMTPNASKTDLVALDGVQGSYTDEIGSTLVLNGLGNFTWGEKSGTYTFDATVSASEIKAYVVADGKNVEYYEITLQDSTFTASKVMVNITYDLAGVDAIEDVIASGSYNKNIAIELPTYTNATSIFLGWYVSGDSTETLVETSAYIPTVDVTLVAKWAVKHSVTVVYGNGMDTETIIVASGKPVSLESPNKTNGMVFDHWYLSADGGVTESSVYDVSTPVTEDLTIYASWMTPPIYMNDYYGAVFYAYSTSGSSFLSNPLSFAKDGTGTPDGTVFKLKNSGYDFSSVGLSIQITIVNESTGEIKITYVYDYTQESDDYWGGSTTTKMSDEYYGIIDSETGIIVLNKDKKTEKNGDSITGVWVLIPSTERFSVTDFSTCEAWNSNKTKPIYFYKGSEYYGILFHNGKIYVDVSFVDDSNNAFTTLTGANKSPVFIAKDKDGNVILDCAYNGSTMVVRDGHQGDYALTYGELSYNLTFSGTGSVSSTDGITGTYSFNADTNTYDLYLTSDGVTVYYVMTSGVSELEKPMVTVTYETAYGTVASETVNKNVSYNLVSGLVDADNVFVGWYLQGDATETIVTSVIPTKDVTYVAKWLAKVKLTLVYGNGYDSEIISFATGSSVDLSSYTKVYTNGQRFIGWYSDEALTTEASLTTITADTVVYGKWIESLPYEIVDASSSTTYAWIYDEIAGTYTSGNKGKNNSKSVLKITAFSDIVISLQYACSSENVDKFDFFHIDINGVQMVSWGNSDLTNFKSYSTKLPAGSVMTLTYQKDSSTHTGDDSAIIKDLTIVSHVCVFDQEVVDAKYLKTPANCQSGAVYYKSCLCGNAGTETFVTATLGTHVYVDHVCSYCGTAQSSASLTLVKNNGIPDEVIVIWEGEVIDYNAIKPAKSGNAFVGWFLADGTEFTETTITEDVTVYARWEISSPFGGYVFTGNYFDQWEGTTSNIKITFDQGAEIKGLFETANGLHKARFTATITDNVIVFHFTENIAAADDFVGKDLTGTLSGDTITFTSWTPTASGAYTFANDGSVKCEGFVYVDPHTHEFTIQNPIKANLASEATCQRSATYYYVCACGGIGTATYAYGDVVDHVFVDGQCKWCGEPAPVDSFTVTFVYNNGTDDLVLSIAIGSTVGTAMPTVPTKEGYDFVGWFVGDVEFTADSVISGNTVVTAIWEETKVPAIVGTWKGFNLHQNNISNSQDILKSSYITTIDASGNINQSYCISGSVDLTQYGSVVDGSLMIGGKYAYLNANAGVLWYSYNANATSVGDDTCLMFDERVERIEYSGSKFLPYYSAWITVYYVDGTTMNVFLYQDRVYDEVTWNEGLIAKDVQKSSAVITKDKNGQAIAAYVNKSFVDFDGYQGSYFNASSTELVLDGIGGFVLGEKKGTYTIVEDGVLEMYVVVDGVNVEYYDGLVSAGEYTLDKPMIDIVFDTEYGDVTDLRVNKNIAIELPSDLTEATHVLKGWYDSDDETETILPNKYVPTKDVMLVAKWEVKITLTVVYGNGLDTVVIDYASGDTVAPQQPAITNGKVFDHWYLSDDDGVTESSVYTVGEITEHTVIYCAWFEAHALYGEYKGFETYHTGNGYLLDGKTASIDVNGKATSGKRINYLTADFDATTGFVKFSSYYGYYDAVNGILVYNDSTGTGDQSDVLVMFKNAESVTASSGAQISWSKGTKKLIDVTVKYTDGTTKSMILYFADKKIQVVTVTSDPADLSIGAMFSSSTYVVNTLTVSDLDGNVIVTYAPSADKKDLLVLDGSQGTYTCEGAQDLVLSGTGSATLGEDSGSVTKAPEGSTYSYDFYITVAGVKTYYELTIDVEAKTYSIVKPMVTVSFDLGGKGTIESLSVNKNIEFSLSAYKPTFEGYVFKEWYKESEFNTKVTALTPTEDVTVYAKWNAIYTVYFETEYGETPASKQIEENAWLYYGDRPVLTADGFVFRGWYVKGDETQKLISGGYKVTGDVVLVAKWEGAVTLTIVYNKDGLSDVVLSVGPGDEFDLKQYKPAQASDGQVFDNWYADDTLTTIFDATSITENTVIYCGWKEASAFLGEYKGANYDPNESSDVTYGNESHRVSLVVDADGVVLSGAVVSKGHTFMLTTEGEFKIGISTTWRAGGYDLKYGILYYDYQTSITAPNHNIYVMFKTIDGVTASKSVGSAWNEGCTKLFTVTYSDNHTLNVFIYNRRIYGGVTFVATDVDGNEITDIANVYSANTVYVLNDEGKLIAGFKKNGSNKLTYDETVGPAVHNHTWDSGVITSEPTCTEVGTKTFTCTECGETTTEEIKATGHTEVVDIAVKPTCTKTGLTEGKHCSVCNEVLVKQNEVEALGHDWNDGVVTTEPKCTEAGVKTFTCTECGETTTEEIKATGHTEAEAVEENRVESTCTTAGHYDSVVYCSKCREELSRNTINLELAAHQYSDLDPEVSATCETNGISAHYTCANCDKVFDSDKVETTIEKLTISALGHSYTWEITTNPSVTDRGIETGTCANDNSHTTTRACALTIAEAISVIKEGKELSNRYVLGSYAGLYNTNGYYLQDESIDYKFIVYKPTLGSYSYDDMHIGDLMLVKGNITAYKTDYEFAQYSTIEGFAHIDSCYINIAKERLTAPAKEYNKDSDLSLQSVITAYEKEVTVTWSVKEADHKALIDNNAIVLPTDTSAVVTLVASLTYGETTETVEFANISIVALNAHVHVYNPANQTCEELIDGVACGTINPEYLVSISGGDVKSLLFGSGYNSKGVSSYSSSFDSKNDGMTWTIANFNNNNNSWSYVKCGNSNNSSIATMTATLDFVVTKITVTVDACNANNVKDFYLTVKDGETVVETINKDIAVGNIEFAITTPKANYTYELSVDCEAVKAIVQISKVAISEQLQTHVADPESVVVTPATCGAEGSVEFICADCDEVFTNVIPMLPEHTYGDWIEEKPATCIGEGTLGHYHCSVCNADFDENHAKLDAILIPVTGNHVYSETYDENESSLPTCTDDGILAYRCTTDGCISFNYVEAPALGHIDDDSDGICDRCEESIGIRYSINVEFVLRNGTMGVDSSLIDLSWYGENADFLWTTKNIQGTAKENASLKVSVSSKFYDFVSIAVSDNITAQIVENLVDFTLTGDVTITVKLDRKTIQLNIPEVSVDANGNATWNVENAKNYKIFINGEVKVESQSEKSYTLASGESIQVVALGYENDTTIYTDSESSGSVTFTAPATPQVVATFNLGADGTASHVDGSTASKYTETVGDYTLTFSALANVYTGARDAKGNGCLKLGTSSKKGSFSFTVSETNVTKVIIYVAMYKDNGTTVNVNGTSYDIKTQSNNGEYTAIEVELTETNRTVSLEATTNRCMIDKIEYIG